MTSNKTNKNNLSKNWEKKCLDNLFSFHGGLGISREQLGNKGIPYLHYGDMHKGTFSSVSYDDYTALPKYDIKINGNEDFLMKDGDVIFLDASEDLTGTSRCVVIDNPDNKPFIAGLHTFIARPLDNSLCKWYKKYFTQTQDVQKQFERLSVGFKVYGVNRNSIKNIVVSFPSDIKEQQKIAKILAKWDEAIELQERLIEKLEIQKKGLMKKLLMPKKDWKKTNSTKIRLIDLCSAKPLYGLNEAATDDITLPRYLRITDINDNGNYVYQGAHVYCEDDVYILKRNDIVFARTGASVGKSYLYNEADGELAFAGFLIKFSIDPKKADSRFISYCCNSKEYWKWVEINCARSGQPGINAEEYSSLNLPYFNFAQEEQKKIANILNKLDIETHLHFQKLELFKKQRKALMQLLLTGTVRV
ncbi:MAG: restriction endonuclease subunit S [Fibromonadaceae bacterium]|jgi:type I restriction enzyme S subunit|nr:restriction endonuclease subunit S [Fibromonadaceae bacterium]